MIVLRVYPPINREIKLTENRPRERSKVILMTLYVCERYGWKIVIAMAALTKKTAEST